MSKRVAANMASSMQAGKPFKQTRLDGFMTSASRQRATAEAEPVKSVEPGSEVNHSTESCQTATQIETSSEPSNSKKLIVKEVIGAIFDAPENTVIIHACNCKGSWSAGIAAAFKKLYPEAFLFQKKHCEKNTPEVSITLLSLLKHLVELYTNTLYTPVYML